MKYVTTLLLAFSILLSCDRTPCLETETSPSDLSFTALAKVWDEAVPLGNGTLGELVWQKGDSLRFSLDHTDLWDLRLVPALQDSEHFNWKWIQERVAAGDAQSIKEKIEDAYSYDPGPTKIPCAALEFPINALGEVASVHLYVKDAICRVDWKSGASLETFVDAAHNVGWFRFNGIDDPGFKPELKVPAYSYTTDPTEGGHSEIGLSALGYETGKVTVSDDRITYHQKGWEDYFYDVAVQWKRSGSTLCGVWSVSTSLDDSDAAREAANAITRGLADDWKSHSAYWDAFWDASSVSVPDPVLQRQYDSEMYKLGSASRENSRPISLQAVWTADDGHLPPWRGDYHNDLNTQLSYWPVYEGNHLAEGKAYINTMWNQQDAFRKYTKGIFGVDGIIVPGVTSLDGQPMGGWTQYSISSTVGAWISQHFYLHWKYSADDEFLRDRAYPFTKEVATALEQLSVFDAAGHRTFELSASPEIFDNTLDAWFHTITNYDLSLTRFAFTAAAEEASALGLDQEAAHWSKVLSEFPDFDIQDDALTFAKGFPYHVSHRHFSHAMAIFPLGLIDWSDGEESQKIIKATVKQLDEKGPEWWCGYSYSWFGNMKARAMDGEGAAEALRTFAECFVLPNSFHANGDQTKSGKSNFEYRPFTLEGNFAFASGIQQMLMQSHTGTIRVFPAIPDSWKDVSFSQLRARGAFLVSAQMKDGQVAHISVYSEKGGKASIQIPGEDAPRQLEMAAGEDFNWPE